MSPHLRPFSEIAEIYDLLFDDIDYEGWALYISKLLNFARIPVRRILEVGCGTGNLTRELVKLGYEVVGVDVSEGMLKVAQKKLPDVRFLRADVREMDLGEQFDAVISTFDSLNNLLTEADLARAFGRIRAHLKPRGIFVGDLNTPHAMMSDWNDALFVKELKDGTLSLWRGEYLGDGVSQLTLTLFIPTGEGLYRRMDEVFKERGYSPAVVKRLLKSAGFLQVWAFDDLSFEKPTKRSKRITYAAI
ncbi:MAG: class I SAM-dependent methyltransferase [Thermotogae bacterium]|nr:class I SAM-dependent methyltransferase [Thermotogota bacterium]